MVIDDPKEIRRLVLQFERDVAAQQHLRALLTTADAQVRDRQAAVRRITARIKRTKPTRSPKAP